MQIGIHHTLTIQRNTSVGMYLANKAGEEVLLPKKYILPHFNIGDSVEVFVYNDHEQRIIATTKKPQLTLHQFAYLSVAEVNAVGAFMEWGIDKHLLVPYREQNQKMIAGKRYVVYMYYDDQSGRLAASAKLNKFFINDEVDLAVNQEVSLLVFETTPLGFNVVVDHQYKGLIYHSELRRPLNIGDSIKGYVRNIREDFGLDISLHPSGLKGIEDGSEVVMNALQKAKGFLPIHDKSEPEEIANYTGLSKKQFKRAVGMLYKARKVLIEEKGIRLIS